MLLRIDNERGMVDSRRRFMVITSEAHIIVMRKLVRTLRPPNQRMSNIYNRRSE
jgi:hypothetical protein